MQVTLKAQGANGELPGGDLLDGDAVGLVEGVSTVTQACASENFIDLVCVCGCGCGCGCGCVCVTTIT